MGVRAFGAVLAGGRARRLAGADKALLDLGEGPLLGRTLALLGPLTTGVAVIGDPHRYTDLGVPVHPDLRPGCGPLGGLETALRVSDAPHVLLLACDLPFVGEHLLEALLEAPEGPDVVVPHRRGVDETLCARYSLRLLSAVEASLDAGRNRMTDLYVGRDVLRLDLEALHLPEEELTNINRPEDLLTARVVAAARRRPGLPG